MAVAHLVNDVVNKFPEAHVSQWVVVTSFKYWQFAIEVAQMVFEVVRPKVEAQVSHCVTVASFKY